mgnify:CR=1 FL=1
MPEQELQGLTPHHYRGAMFDFPWKFSAGTKGRPQHYPRMTDAEIAAFPIELVAHPEGCNFFVWITSPIDGPRFWEKIWPAWKQRGLRYSGRAFVWIKTHAVLAHGGEPLFIHRDSLHKGQGFTTRKGAEDCLLFKTGRPPRLSKNIHEVIISPLREHSRKPEEAYARIEKYSPGPLADVFSRRSRPGWDAWGNEAGKFDGVAA